MSDTEATVRIDFRVDLSIYNAASAERRAKYTVGGHRPDTPLREFWNILDDTPSKDLAPGEPWPAVTASSSTAIVERDPNSDKVTLVLEVQAGQSRDKDTCSMNVFH